MCRIGWRARVALVVAVLFWSAGLHASNFKSGVWRGHNISYLEGQLLIKWQSWAEQRHKSQLLGEIKGEFIRPVGSCQWELIQVDTGAVIPQLAEDLLHDESIFDAEPLVPVELGSGFSDPEYQRQYYFENNSQIVWYEAGDTAGNNASAFFSWAADIVADGGQVRYGWIDTGLKLDSATSSHSTNDDLDDSTHVVLALNSIDGEDSTLVHDDDEVLFKYHGTRTLGIVAATRNNDHAIAGIDPSSQFLVIRGMRGVPEPSTQKDAVDAFAYAIDHGVDIINFSGGWNLLPLMSLEAEIVRAAESSIVVTTITGNGGGFWFPGGYGSVGTCEKDEFTDSGYRNVIATGGTSMLDNIAAYSNRMYVTDQLDGICHDTILVTVVAPSDVIVTTYLDDWFQGTGTSFASPQVAGLVGLIKAKYGEISPDSIRAIIENTADKIWQDPSKPAYDVAWESSSWHPWYGLGRINAWRALTWDELWGEYSTSQTWSGDRIVASDIVIDSGATVTITPGTKLRVRPIDHFDASSEADSNLAEIIVKGTLIADALGDSTITFEPYGAVTGDSVAWYGIRVVDNGKVVLRNVEVSNAYLGIDLESSGADTVYDCRFVNNRNYGIYVRNDSAASVTSLVRKNTILKDSATTLTGYGIRTFYSPTIDSNTISFYGYGVYAYGYNPQVKSNHFHCCTYGIHARNTDEARVWYNHFTGSFSYAIDYWHASVSTRYNQVCIDTSTSQDGCLVGLAFGPYGSGEVWFNQFFNCLAYGATVSGSFPNFGENGEVIKGRNWFRVPAWSGTDTAFAFYSLNTIKAEKNFWQLGDSALVDSSSIDFWIRGSGAVDVTPFLALPPDPGEYGGGQETKLTVAAYGLPESVGLDQNFPNPFNPVTTISYSLQKPAEVRIEILNIIGQRVRLLIEEHQASGSHQVTWDGRDDRGRDCSTGVYFYRLSSSEFSSTKKMLLLK